QGNRTQLMQGSTTLITDFDTTTNKPNGYWFGAQKNDENHIEFLYDKNGNRLNKQLKTAKNELLLDITYAWNAQNRMTRYTLNGTTQTNKYQFSGPRYEKKETSPEGTETTRFYPDDSLRLLSEKVTDAKGQKSYAYIYLGTQKLARISKNVVTQKDEISYFLNDALGTPAWITYAHTASPNEPILISQNLRDPWGNEMGSTLFNQTPVRDFTGKQLDTLSNLYDFGFRYYDSLLGTWIGKDLVPADYTAPLSLNEYLFCLSNPLRYGDKDGRRVTVWAQEVAFGQYHSSIRIVPDNQSLYKNNPNFKLGEDGKLFATLGAGPSIALNLKAGINRPKDILSANKVLESVPLHMPKGLNEDSAIQNLFQLHSNYKNNVEYDLFPAVKGGNFLNDGYNSNSYTTGLLKAGGFETPPLDQYLSMPGYNKPLPESNFTK
ncbi:MAG: RHS repeat domain-containing protein, partial [Bacteriovoracia bacterium]